MLPSRSNFISKGARLSIAFIKTYSSSSLSKPPKGPRSLRSKVAPQSSASQTHQRPSLTLLPSTALNYGHWPEPQSRHRNRNFSNKHFQSKKNFANMNVGSQNVSIPGLTLLKSMAPPHPATATPMMAANNSSTQGKNTQKVPRYTGAKMDKFALRKQTEAEARARKAAAGPPPPQQFGFPRPGLKSPRQLTSNHRSRRIKKSEIPQQDERLAPSKESGGIPDATPLYLAQALAPPNRLEEPRRILVIMDLNGTLLYRPNKRNPFNFIERPHARQFMSYCIETFHVAVWSSARPDNVKKMVAQLLTPEQRAKCTVIWARDKFGLSPADYDTRVQCYKRLTTIWSDPSVIASHPAASHGQRWDQTNTVLVDDSIEKGRSEPHNILEIPEFSGPQNEAADVLPQVHDYLNLLCYQSDVSRYMRQSPFRLDTNYKLGELSIHEE